MLLQSLGLLVLTSKALAQCSRSQLQQASDEYLAAVKSGGSALDVGIYTENFASSTFKEGIHSKAIKVSAVHSLLDTTDCATFHEIMAHQNSPPMVIGTQIHYSGAKITKMETIYSSDKIGTFSNPAKTAGYIADEVRNPIPEAKRDTRALIKEIADQYFDKFSNGSIQVPHHTPCVRIEGSMRVQPDCTSGIMSAPGRKMTNRRFVIDEEMGTVSVFLWFNGEGATADGHTFRIEDGKLRYVHAIMVPTGGAKAKGGRGG
ncbi:hypothetical protein EJ08DRAFT_652980 [Tothia fuscella]|uniref:DUF8021 domain-containing protein n=1 Tax=Tothia fuscella TaxID=1048955 RepID=A0A9P4NII5_9PEZI|nr:hypothetical protein EJ08DRAFT_652980 [Tothia fuscella]